MSVQHRLLFNFAASYSTGGYKRLYEYARWFDRNGGAWFVIHPRCTHLITEFPNNRCFVARQSQIERLYNDCALFSLRQGQLVSSEQRPAAGGQGGASGPACAA
jgi:hypothetical protein